MSIVSIFIAVLLSVLLLSQNSLGDIDIITKSGDETSRNLTCYPLGNECTHHEECCSNACLTYLHKCVSSLYAADENLNQSQVIDSSTIKEKIDSRIQKTPAIDEDSSKRDCTGIGKFCSGHRECCTGACHSYLRKCVSANYLQDEEDKVEETPTDNKVVQEVHPTPTTTAAP